MYDSHSKFFHASRAALLLPAVLFATALPACGDDGPGPDTDGGAPALDATLGDAGELNDGAARDGGADLGATVDGGDLGGCGDGLLEGDELCDGDTVDCTSLGTSYASGNATCRASCDGYDVSTCERGEPMLLEYVKPAERDARWLDAQCSETGAPFFFTVGLTGSDRWHIELAGGGFCSDTAISPCYGRPGSLTRDREVRGTGDDRMVVTPFDGERYGAVEAPLYPRSFSDANRVHLHYCSNDVWSGTRVDPLAIPGDAEGATTMPFRFAGRINVRATIEALQQRFGLDDANPELRVFVTGNSAGGFGTLLNVDQFAAALPNTAAAGRLHAMARAGAIAQGWGAVDAELAGDWSLVRTEDGAPTGTYLDELDDDLVQLFQSEFSAPCEAAHAADRSQCMYAGVATPFLTAPAPEGLGLNIAIVQNLADPFYANIHGMLVRTSGYDFVVPGGEAATTAYGDLLANQLDGLRWLYAPRHPLRFHGIPPHLPPEDTTVPSLRDLAETFVSSTDPAPFSYLDFGLFQLP